MNWEPKISAVMKIQEKRTTWVSKDTSMYRKEKVLCMRCRHRGHISPQCNHFPSEKPITVQKKCVKIEEDIEDFDVVVMPEGVNFQRGKEELLQ